MSLWAIVVRNPGQGLANFLGVTATEAKGVVIVGSNPLARLIARLFKEHDEPVVLIDTNARAVQEAEREDLRAFLNFYASTV